MANNKKFVVKNGLTTSNIEFKDDINNGTNTITMSMLSTDVLSFSGDSGQLFSISDSLTGTIFSVNDISGIPSLEVDDDGTIRLAEFAGNILVGSNTDNGSDKLQVTGNTSVNGTIKATDFTIGTSGKLASNNYLQSLGYTTNTGDVSNNYLQGLGFTTNVGDVTNTYLTATFSSNNYLQGQLSTKLNSSSYTASDVLAKIKTVDGSGSGLDADTLDGLQGSSYSSNNYITDHYTSNNYIQSYVAAQVASVVDSAPAALDTLNELAAALGDDANFSTTVSNQIGIRSTNTYVNSTFSSNNYLQGQLSTKLDSSSYTASDVLTKIKTVDGSGSGLDADTLDGIQGSGFLQTSGGTLTGALSGTSLSLSSSASGTQFTGTAQSTTAPTTDDAKFDGFGVQGNRTTNPIYIHNQGAGGVRISSNATLGTQNGILVKDTVTDISGNLTISGTVDGRDIATDGSKLDGIEAGATADQTASEILTAIKTVDGSGSGLDADLLDGIQATGLVSNNYFQDNSGGGGATGGGSDKIFHNNDQTVTTSYTIPSGQNFMTAGPISINSGVTVTVPSGSDWTIV